MGLSKQYIRTSEFLLVSFFAISYWILTGLWDGSGFGTDMQRYYALYLSIPQQIGIESIIQSFSLEEKDPFFALFQLIPRTLGFSFNFSLLFLIFNYYNAALFWLRKLINKDIFLIKFFVLSLYSFVIISVVNVILRQGFSSLIILIFLFNYKDSRYNLRKMINDLVVVCVASFIHLGTIIALPYVLLRPLFEKYTSLFNRFFYICFLFYISSLFDFLGSYILGSDSIFLSFIRAMSNTESSYVIGPTLGKSLTIIAPVILLKYTRKNFRVFQNKQLEMIFLFYKYIMVVGMIFSGFPYYDRILILGWIYLPLLLVYPFLTFVSSFVVRQSFLKDIRN